MREEDDKKESGMTLDRLKRMSGGQEGPGDDQTHRHEMPDGSFTGPAIKSDDSESMHVHEYGDGKVTSPSRDDEAHSHETEMGKTSGPR